VAKLYKEVESKLRNNNIKPPHKNTLYNRIKALTQREKDEAMLGAEAAKKRHKAHPHRFPGADFPLAVTQIDHTKLNIEVVDDIHRLPIGRPWITLLMDVFSRMVLGFYISLDPPNSMSVGLCLAQAILPKDVWLASHNIDIAWPCWGFMRKIHADNAGEFRGKMLKTACAEYNIDLEWRPVKKPHYGAHIERLLGTFSEEVNNLPGTTFSNIKDKGDYDSEKEAILTLSELERNIALFIVGEYHQRIHSALNLSPIQQMEKGVFGTKEQPGTGLPPRFFDEDRLRLNLTPYEKRTIQPGGVVFDRIHYYSSVFERYVGLRDPDHPNRKPKFIFKRDPRNIKYIHFYDPDTKQYYEVPYRDMAHPAMSIWEYHAVRRHLREVGVEDAKVDEDLIFRTHEKRKAELEEAAHKTKAARREVQRRAQNAQITRPRAAGQENTDDMSERLQDGASPNANPPTIGSFPIDDSDR
jgi:putative transposase